MQEDCIGSQGTQHDVALQKKKVKNSSGEGYTQHARIPRHHKANISFTKNRQLKVFASRNQVNFNLQQWSSTQ